ncbi:hypothetical protein V2J09_004869 [Rumex salicifolius]
MSSDFFMFDECLYQQHSTILNSEETQFLSESDPFSAPSDSSIDSILQEFSEETSTILEKFEPNPLYQRTRFSNSSDCFLKTEDPPLRLDSRDCFLGSRSYGGVKENGTTRLSQRSYIHGSHSYNGEKPWFLFQQRFFDSLFESSAVLCSRENGFSNNPQMRRVCSTGDLPMMGKNQTNVEWESNAATTTNLMQEANLKVGRYNAEERKERIDRYKAKRTQRNFNKTIKYACRKTLADNRARVRGRFARNDEPGDMPKSAPSSSRYDGDDILLYGWYEEEDLGIASSGGGGDTGGSAGGSFSTSCMEDKDIEEDATALGIEST